MLTRRILLGAAAGAFVVPGRADAMFLSKLPWKEIVAVGANVAALVEFFRNTLMGGGGSGGGASAAPAPQAICAAKRSDLATINRLCFQLALATNTKDYQAAIEIGDGGLLAALAAYADKPSPSAWRRVRNEALVFMTTTERLLNELGREGGIVDALDLDSRARVLNEVRSGLRVVNEAVWTIYVTGGEPDDPASAKETLAILEGLPGLLDRAQRASAELMEARSTARC